MGGRGASVTKFMGFFAGRYCVLIQRLAASGESEKGLRGEGEASAYRLAVGIKS